jgi:hypothetical protein
MASVAVVVVSVVGFAGGILPMLVVGIVLSSVQRCY